MSGTILYAGVLADDGTGDPITIPVISGGTISAITTTAFPVYTPIAETQSDWNQSNSSLISYIKNKPATRSQSSASRSLNSIFQISSTRDAVANYSVDVSTIATLLGGQTGTVFLEISPSATFSSGIQEVARSVNGNSVSLALAITLNQSVTSTLSGYIPAGYYARLRTDNTTGSPTFTYRSGQEVLL